MTWLRVKTKKGHNFPSVDPNRKAQRLTELLSLGFLIHNAVLWTTQTPWHRRSPLWDFKICIWQKVGHRFYSEAPIRTKHFQGSGKSSMSGFPHPATRSPLTGLFSHSRSLTESNKMVPSIKDKDKELNKTWYLLFRTISLERWTINK